MVRILLAPAMLGLLVLACGRDRAGEAGMNRDTLAPPVGAARASDTTGQAAPAPSATGDSANALNSQAAHAPAVHTPAPAGPAPVAPAPPAPATSDTPPGQPNIHPQRTREPPTVPKPAVTPRDTTPAAAANAPLRDAYHQAPRDTVSATVYNGWKQFNLNCSRCHGEDVLGTTIAPHLIASLKPGGPIGTKELFVQTVCSGRPAKGMPAWCAIGLDTAKIEQIYAYVKGRSDATIGPGRPAVRP